MTIQAYKTCLIAEDALFNSPVFQRAVSHGIELVKAPDAAECLRHYEQAHPYINLNSDADFYSDASDLLNLLTTLPHDLCLILLIGDSSDTSLRLAFYHEDRVRLSHPIKLTELLNHLESWNFGPIMSPKTHSATLSTGYAAS